MVKEVKRIDNVLSVTGKYFNYFFQVKLLQKKTYHFMCNFMWHWSLLSEMPENWQLLHSYCTVCILLWTFILSWPLVVWSHWSHLWLMWVFKCDFRLEILMKECPHWLHLFTFSPVCVLTWFFREAPTENKTPHSLHLYGFSPVCVRLCMMRSVVEEQAYLHWVHLWGFSPLWVFKWSVNILAVPQE